jgi:hypothetical protein
MPEPKKHPPRFKPQPDITRDPRAEEAANTGDIPPAAPGAAGESAPGQPSRAEIFSLNPALASKDGAANTGPTGPEGPEAGAPYVAGAPKAGKTESLETAPVSERPDWSSTPEERHQDMAPPRAKFTPPPQKPRPEEP